MKNRDGRIVGLFTKPRRTKLMLNGFWWSFRSLFPVLVAVLLLILRFQHCWFFFDFFLHIVVGHGRLLNLFPIFHERAANILKIFISNIIFKIVNLKLITYPSELILVRGFNYDSRFYLRVIVNYYAHPVIMLPHTHHPCLQLWLFSKWNAASCFRTFFCTLAQWNQQ